MRKFATLLFLAGNKTRALTIIPFAETDARYTTDQQLGLNYMRINPCLRATLLLVATFLCSTAVSAQDEETIEVETKLVTVPVIATKRDGSNVTDLRQEEFAIEEDEADQKIAFFGEASAPFHVVLMLDTSASTEEKLVLIRRAAERFVEELQPADRVKLISFDDEVKDAGDFTGDRTLIKKRIVDVRAGRGTKLYDAMAQALRSLRKIEGRKAVVIFTDGVDYRSDDESYNSNRRALEESGVIVYPIRYDTRADTERLAREQARAGGQTTDIGSILGGSQPRGTTPTTFPGGTTPPLPSTIPGTIRLPVPIQLPRRRTDDPYPGGRRDDERFPNSSRDPTLGRSTNSSGMDEHIKVMLDRLYSTADAYLAEIARASGGRLLRADTPQMLPEAFAQIVAELRTQYSLGYYPTNGARDGKYRKIKVRTTRKGVAVRARPGYRAPRG